MEIFKYILPAFIVMMTAYLLLDKMLNAEAKRRQRERSSGTEAAIVPIRLRAYERLMLLLERTNPGTMVLQVIQPGMKSIELQTKLLSYIRQEFEHNFSQQIYVSDSLWRAITLTEENLSKLINTTASHFKPDDSASAFAETLIRIYSEADRNPTQMAIELLKAESRKEFFQNEES